MLRVAMIAVAIAGEPQVVQAPLDSVAVVSGPSLFDPLPEMWGLAELSLDADLEALQGLVLYLDRRAVFRSAGAEERVYFGGGRQLVADRPLTESDIADELGSLACLCALEYGGATSSGELHVAAGAYHSSRASAVTVQPQGIVRVEFELQREGQPDRVKLHRLVCWPTSGGTVASIAAALPGFVKLTRKTQPGFVDPPMDDRPVRVEAPARLQAGHDQVLALADGLVGFQDAGGLHGFRLPERLDAPELVGSAKPGLFTFIAEIGNGGRRAIDHSDYFLDLGVCSRRIDRLHGIRHRDSTYWP